MSQPLIPSFSETLLAFRVQRSTLVAVTYREAIARFSRRSLGLFEEIGGIVIMVGLFVGFRMVAGLATHRGMDLVPFCLTGVMNLWLFRLTMARCMSFPTAAALYSGYPRVTPLDVSVGRAVVNIILMLAVFMAGIALMRAVGWSHEVKDLLRVIMISLVSGLFGWGMGLVFGGLLYFVPSLHLVMLVFMRLLIFVSGVFFVIPEIPYKIREYVLYNPIVHLADFMREAYFPTYEASQASAGYVATWVLGSVFLGLVVERAMRAWTQPSTT